MNRDDLDDFFARAEDVLEWHGSVDAMNTAPTVGRIHVVWVWQTSDWSREAMIGPIEGWREEWEM